MTDKEIWWRRRRLYIPAAHWGNGSANGETITNQTSIGCSGFAVVTTNDVLVGHFRCPVELDPNFDVGFRVHMMPTGDADIGTVGNALLVDFRADETVAVAASTALDTTIADVAVAAVTNQVQWSPRGIKSKGFLSGAQVDDAYVNFKLSPTATTLTSGSSLTLLGIEMDYMPRSTRFPHCQTDGPLDDASP